MEIKPEDELSNIVLFPVKEDDPRNQVNGFLIEFQHVFECAAGRHKAALVRLAGQFEEPFRIGHHVSRLRGIFQGFGHCAAHQFSGRLHLERQRRTHPHQQPAPDPELQLQRHRQADRRPHHRSESGYPHPVCHGPGR